MPHFGLQIGTYPRAGPITAVPFGLRFMASDPRSVRLKRTFTPGIAGDFA